MKTPLTAPSSGFRASVWPRMIGVIGCGCLLYGCSIYEAIHAPAPVEYKHVRAGETREETIGHLGYPKMTEKTKDGKKVDRFEFMDGYHPASKGRVVLYLAGDVFTAGLAELIFWPMEMAVFDGKFCRATVTYGPDERVQHCAVVDKKGTPLWISPEPAAVARPVPTATGAAGVNKPKPAPVPTKPAPAK